jgi:hypothetical protein
MKNIHVLPTDKPSRLHFTEFEEELIFTPKYEKLNGINIYITSDEEIKEGDLFIDDRYKQPMKYFGEGSLLKSSKKIILTTDQDLIKDGVWGIEDGFLEWFVKNPTCEYVELKGYAIILPGESCDCDNICNTCKEKEPKLQCKDCNDNLTDCTCIEDTIDMKQETMEYDLLQHIKFCLECKNESQAIRLIEKYGFVKQETLEENVFDVEALEEQIKRADELEELNRKKRIEDKQIEDSKKHFAPLYDAKLKYEQSLKKKS